MGANPRSFLWGLDLLGYLPLGQRVGLTILIAIGLAFIFGSIVAGKRRSHLEPAGADPAWLALFLVPLASLLWLLRDRVHLLGDGLTWIEVLKSGSRPLYSEPLAAVAMHGVASIAGSIGRVETATALGLFSVGCGLVAAALYYYIACDITSSRTTRAIAMGLFITLGCNQLYFGYIESYPAVSVTILLYLWLLLRCLDRQLPLALAALALAMAISSHFITLILIPSFVFLVLRERQSWIRSGILLATPLAVSAAILVFLRYPFSTVLEPVRLVTGADGAATMSLSGLLTKALKRIPHLMNLCFLVAPLPLVILLARLARLRRRDKADPKTRALFIAAASGLLAAIVLSSFVFPGHDWDLITMALLPGIVLAVKLGVEYLAKAAKPVAVGLIGLGAASLLAFVLVNANESSAVRRYDALLAADIPLSAHERAYGNERLVKVYTSRRNAEAALAYAQRAVQSDPANDRYWANVGSVLYNLKRYQEAVRYFEDAARRGSTRPEVYYYLAQSLIRQNRSHEALQPAQRAVDLGGEWPNYLFTLGLARAGSGDLEGARRVWDHVLELWPDDRRTRQAYDYYFRHRSSEIER